MHTALRLLLLTLTALLLQAAPAWAQAKEASTKSVAGVAVPRLLPPQASAAKPCEARSVVLTAWEEFEFATADNTLLGMAGDEERCEMQAPSWELASPTPPPQIRPFWVMALLPNPWLPGRLRPPIAAAS